MNLGYKSTHFDVHPLKLSRLERNRMLLIQFLQRIKHSGSGLAVLVSQIQKINNLTNRGIFDHNHMLREHFQQGKQAPLDIEPGIRVQLNERGCTFFWMG